MAFIKKNIPIVIIIIFHFVGIIGLYWFPEIFTKLTFLNILLSVVLVLYTSKQTTIWFYLSLFLIALVGYSVEVLGVKTGVIFGHYWYGNSLGIKIASVPLLIGLNWAVLVYCTLQFFTFKHSVINALGGALLMVFLDYFIEQNAAKFDFWYWKNNIIPIQNFVAWFLISFVLNLFFIKYNKVKANVTAKVFYVVQVLFFVILFMI